MMQFVPEAVIDEVIAHLESTPEFFENALAELYQHQPALASFILSNHEGTFDEEEHTLLLFMLLVVWKSFEAVNGPQPPVAPGDLEEAEEENWEILERLPASVKKFRERLDVLFESSRQEDLLAFVEDALLEDEEEGALPITREGREPIFVLMKTVIDCLD
ncbi:MAG: hypothetical protein RL386_1946 [Bacteroidota bacterium]|jgi:hypothetical protein